MNYEQDSDEEADKQYESKVQVKKATTESNDYAQSSEFAKPSVKPRPTFGIASVRTCWDRGIGRRPGGYRCKAQV